MYTKEKNLVLRTLREVYSDEPMFIKSVNEGVGSITGKVRWTLIVTFFDKFESKKGKVGKNFIPNLTWFFRALERKAKLQGGLAVIPCIVPSSADYILRYLEGSPIKDPKIVLWIF